MLNSLAALKQRTKMQIADAKKQGTLSSTNTTKIDMEEKLKMEKEKHRKKILEEIDKAESILPSTAVDESVAREVDNQIVDSWAKIVSEFKRALDNSPDLRIPMADQEVLEEQPNDHSTVKFFKGILTEWRLRLFALTDDELKQRKPELTTMWYCMFALQPLFNGLNNHTLSTEISTETGEIAKKLRELDYKGALDHYHSLAIGNSLWPIGITQYSIHWKFSCDLIDSDRILHIFNNEPGRNAIVSIKRLMTKHQEFHNVQRAF